MNCRMENHLGDFFKVLRDVDGLTYQVISASLDLDMNVNKIFKAGLGAGKSGSFFFFSHDSKLIIKTIIESEMKLLMKMVGDVNNHILTSQNQSLLARIYGMYTIKSP